MFKKMLLLVTVVLLSMNGSVLAIDHWWHGGVSDDLNDPANWTDRDATTPPTTPTGPSRTDIVRIGASWDSEDLDGNGILDPGEDLNGNGLIDDPDPNSGVGWGGYYGEGGGIDLAVDPVLRETYVSRDGLNSIGWLFMLNAPNILTLEDGAFLIISRQDSNIRNGGRIEVQGRSDTDGPSLIVPHSFRIAENGSVPEAAHETSQLRINGTGWMQMDPAIRGSGAAFMIGTPDEPGTMPRGEIIIEDDGILEILPGDDPNNAPYLDFGNADPSVNQIIIRGNGELLLPGDPAVIGVVGPNDVVTSLDELIDMGLITSETGITVSGSNPTIVKAAASPFTVKDIPAIGTDAAIGIDPAKTYTHAFDFGTNAPAIINGMVMDQGPTENIREPYVGVSSQGYGYIIDDTRASFRINCHGGSDASDQADGDSAEMLRDMIYFSGANVNEGIVFTLQDLIPGTEYSVRYYYRAWDPELPRPITIIADDGESIDIDIDKGGAHYLDYTFVADDNDVSLTFICNVDNQGAHLYGLTCEEVPAAPAMVAHWPMDEGAGTVVADVVGGNDGIMVGLDPAVAWITDGALGGAVSFDNTNGHNIVVPHAPELDFGDGDFSISLWLRYPTDIDITGETDRWICKGSYGSPGTGKRYEFYLAGNDRVRWAIDDDVVKSRIEVVQTPFLTGDWVHAVAIRNTVTKQMSVYANGVPVDVYEGGDVGIDGTGNISSGEDMRIGDTTNDDAPMLGDIDDVRIFDKALTEDEIAAVASL